MRRDLDLRPHPADHLPELVDARMPGNVHEMGTVGDDLDSLGDETVDHPHDRLLVAGNGARGENHAVAARERDLGMVVLRDAGERRARLALAAGTERQHLVRREMAVEVGAAEFCTPSR